MEVVWNGRNVLVNVTRVDGEVKTYSFVSAEDRAEGARGDVMDSIFVIAAETAEQYAL